MSDEEWMLQECALALAAARPFVVDGRPNKDAERTLPIVDAAPELALTEEWQLHRDVDSGQDTRVKRRRAENGHAEDVAAGVSDPCREKNPEPRKRNWVRAADVVRSE